MRDPVLAGFLSLIIPGVGQLYNGQILWGILWLLFTPGFWIGTGGMLGWVCHLVAAYTAYRYAVSNSSQPTLVDRWRASQSLSPRRY